MYSFGSCSFEFQFKSFRKNWSVMNTGFPEAEDPNESCADEWENMRHLLFAGYSRFPLGK